MLRLSLVIGVLIGVNLAIMALVWWLDKREARRATVQARLDAYRVIEARAWKEDEAARARRSGVDEMQIDNFSLWAERNK